VNQHVIALARRSAIPMAERNAVIGTGKILVNDAKGLRPEA
jgi:hypothetical protein